MGKGYKKVEETYLLGVQRKTEKNYVRDIVIKEKGEGSLEYEYIGLKGLRLKDSKYKETDILLRGITDYVRGGKNIHWSRVEEIPKDLLFVNSAGNNPYVSDEETGIAVGYGQRLTKGSYIYKQGILREEGVKYYIVRLEFRSEGSDVKVIGSRVKELPGQKDATVHGIDIVRGLGQDLLQAVQDTLYLYGVCDKLKDKMVLQSVMETDNVDIGATNKYGIELGGYKDDDK